MGKTDRLLNLVALLRDTTRPVPAERIHREVAGYPEGLEAFRRAFSRDKEVLREMGVPLVLEPLREVDGSGEGYRIPAEQYELADLNFADAELEALHVAATLVRVGEADAGSALWKLGGAVGSGANELAHFGLDSSVLAVFDALGRGSDVAFTYRGEQRQIQPTGLRLNRGRWYVAGFDRERLAERLFRTDRIDGDVAVVAAPAVATRHAGLVPTDDDTAAADEWARVWISPLHAWRVERDLGPNAIERRDDDGAVVLRLQVGSPEWLRNWVLGFGEHAELLEPASLRDEMRSWLADLASTPHPLSLPSSSSSAEVG